MADILSKDELDALLDQMQPGDEPEDAVDEIEAAPEDPLSDAAPKSEGVGLDLSASKGEGVPRDNVEMILNIPLRVQVELGRAVLPIGEILDLCQGSVIELDHLASDMIDLTANNRVIAHGEAVVINENFGLRVLEVESVADRIRKL